ncbi:class I SAM-dependent methyltransferase [Persicobacter psychrovividus]|uniref:SAM-dependent methyltransferase n=1 Tax=Persicobacter psychrovividus TaxID=387638 RepID=A0ABM7VBS1_9BACT|nr:SAM-dependent methyltransferase [Persicobacter psychrovividus]
MKKLISFVIKHIPRKYLQHFAHFGAKFLGLFYRGHGVHCNVCDHEYREFLPYGRTPPRANALCPNCLTLERHRLMWRYLEDKTDFFTAPKKVLHIAPELCFIKRFEKMRNLEYITGDLESPLAKVKMDVHQIPFEDHHFDAVFCNHVMEHVEDDHQAMSEIFRVLKKGGFAILQSPQDMSLEHTFEDPSITSPQAREDAYGQTDHVRLFGRDYGQRLKKAGFDVLEDTFVQRLPEEEVRKYGFPAEEIVYFCRKN